MAIRNFCIIAHIDHGKSTLADRMLEITASVKKVSNAQMLDSMDIEQERGITIKLTPARMSRKNTELNLIDTPGHVDFQYEVSRSLAAVEGAVLLIDASQGIQAQTLSTLYAAMEHNLTIIPVLNKIDLPAANPERVTDEIEHLLGIDRREIIKISAKTGMNVDQVLDAIIERIPAPRIDPTQGDKALIFDSIYDPYRGVVVYVKVVSGSFSKGISCQLIHSDTEMSPTEVGALTPRYLPTQTLTAGQIGYIVTGKKSVRDAQIGDTIVTGLPPKIGWTDRLTYAIPGFKKVKPFIYAGVYPVETNEYDKLADAFGKLVLNDSAVDCSPENSGALGLGFRCGFLGMLHMDIIKERLAREYGVETVFTTPTVSYIIKLKDTAWRILQGKDNLIKLRESGLWREVDRICGRESKQRTKDLFLTQTGDTYALWTVVTSGADMIDKSQIESMYEPMTETEVVAPSEYTGAIMALCQDHRATLKAMEHIDQTRIIWRYYFPLGELIIDFYDKLKSATKGYATMNYEAKNYTESNLVKLDILINGDVIEAFSMVVHNDKAYSVGKDLVERLKVLIPRHLFAIPIQAAIGTKIIARETIPAIRKDVLSKCYGGDVSRKRKLLEKQKEGKKKMKAMGNVNIPSDIFLKMIQGGGQS
ncbi:MAG: GTP-binding protein [Candidatus Absconditabacterales bacterium]|nr:GTP-binding protein [Candidatus Absconditabacterales bacterium]